MIMLYTIGEALEAQTTLDRLEIEVRELHDDVCGRGAFLAERSDTALSADVAWGIRLCIKTAIGEVMLESHLKTLERIARKEAK